MSIIIDNGSGVLKAGMGGENTPQVKFPAIVGKPHGPVVVGNPAGEYIGDRALQMAGVCKLSHPIESGIVTDWEDMNKVWEYLFANELRVDPSEHRVMLTEAPHNPKSNREKMTEVMFETHDVQGLYVAIQAVLTLYSNGRTTGTVCDSGDGVSHTVPVFEGFQIPHAVKSNKIAGRAITEHMEKLLVAENVLPQSSRSGWLEIVRGIKENFCFVANDYEKALEEANNSSIHEREYQLPGGETMKFNAARFQAPEALFFPNKIIKGSEESGLHKMTYESIDACDCDIRKALYSNIIVSGGSTMYEGLPERLEKEVDILCPTANLVKVIAPQDRYYSVWNGGSTLATLASFENNWITRDEYDEFGVDIVHTKCV